MEAATLATTKLAPIGAALGPEGLALAAVGLCAGLGGTIGAILWKRRRNRRTERASARSAPVVARWVSNGAPGELDDVTGEFLTFRHFAAWLEREACTGPIWYPDLICLLGEYGGRVNGFPPPHQNRVAELLAEAGFERGLHRYRNRFGKDAKVVTYAAPQCEAACQALKAAA